MLGEAAGDGDGARIVATGALWLGEGGATQGRYLWAASMCGSRHDAA